MNVDRLLQDLTPPLRQKLKDMLTQLHGEDKPLKHQCASPECLEALYAALDIWERLTLEAVVKRMGTAFFHMEQLEKAAHATVCGAGLRWGITGLRQKGILFALKKSWGEPIYILPSDTFAVWQQMLTPGIEMRRLLAEHEAEGNGAIRQALQRDLLNVLQFIVRQQPVFKKDGTLPVRWLQKAAAGLKLEPQFLQGLSGKPTADGSVPLILAVLLATAWQLGLLDISCGRLHVEQNRLRHWFAQVGPRADTALYRIWRERLWPDNPFLAHAAAVLERIPQGKWLPLNELQKWAVQHDIGVNDCLQEQLRQRREQAEWLDDFRRRWLLPMSAFGWLETGIAAESGEEVVRRLIDPPGHGDEQPEDDRQENCGPCMYVQPDFEIVLLPNAPISVRWELMCAAEIVSDDEPSTFRLTKESIRTAVKLEIIFTELLALLQRHAQYGIPDNVKRCVEQWAADALEENGAADHDGARGTNKHENGGIPLHRDAAIPPHRNVAIPPHRTSAQLLPAIADRPNYPSDDRWPEIDQVYPGLARISGHWLKEMRTYHPSTKKELIRQAIEWKALLKLRRCEQDTLFIPVLLREDCGDLAVEGITDEGSVTIPLRVWEEMQLILPGINDKTEEKTLL